MEDSQIKSEPIEANMNSSCSSTEKKSSPMEASKKMSKKKSPAESRAERKQLRSGLRNKKSDDKLPMLMEGLSLADIESQRKGVGLVYNAEMATHTNTWDPKHPETPERLTASYERCKEYGLVERCVQIEAKPCAEDKLLIQHPQEYIDEIKSSKEMTQEELMKLSSKFDGIYFDKTTFQCALQSAGGTIDLVEKVVEGKLRNGMAIIRPPGHHAMKSEACGYCFFNNVAIATKHALDTMDVKRVLIVDWDVHHGQGTQRMFYDDPRVLYFSIHRYDWGQFWPNLRESDYDYIGEGRGRGYNVNVPLNQTGITNGDYMAIFNQLLLPIAYEFSPDLVLVSCGYDTAIGCPEGENEVTPAMFAHFIHNLKQLANGKLCLILEGGYCIKSLSEGVALSLRSLLDDPCPNVGPLQAPCDSIADTIFHVIDLLRPHWKNLAYQEIAEDDCDLPAVWQKIKRPQNAPFATLESKPEKYGIIGCYPTMSEDRKELFDTKINKIIAETNLSVTKNRTCLVYDEAMRAHLCKGGFHPEQPNRITRIYNKHEEMGLLDRCKQLKSRHATDDEIHLVHKPAYVEEVKTFETMTEEELGSYQNQFTSIFLHQESNKAAKLAAGCTLEVVDEVMSGQSRNGVAIVRPPGHHAEPHKACGFCLFNNVALGAEYAKTKYGAKRILIVDWDVHHGNGTQHMFWGDPGVLYVSLHRFDNGSFFPGGDDGDYDQVGSGPGEGFNINIPFNWKHMGNADYIAAFIQVVMPVAYEYCPDLVLVSAGFDAAKGDPLGGYLVTPEGYAQMTHMLCGLANGKVILVLEGGYNLNSISDSMATCTSILLGDLCPTIGPLIPSKWAVKDICNVIDTHSKYWKSLRFRECLPPFEQPKEGLNRVKGQCNSTEHDVLQSASSTSLAADLFDKLTVSDSEKTEPGIHANSNDPMVTSAAVPSDPMLDMAAGGDEEKLEASGGGTGMSDSEVRQFLGKAAEDMADVQLFSVVPLDWCEHLTTVEQLPVRGLDVSDACAECSHVGENWLCLTCYEVHCSRFVNEHMLFHGIESGHKMVLSYADLSVWCYGCDSYVHNEKLLPAKNAAHVSKFGCESGQ